MGYHNVTWVGDRKALPHQLNGKSSNINHMVLNHMYPTVTATKEIPYKDILMVMDCDHLVEPEFFAKCCSVMLDRDVAVRLLFLLLCFHRSLLPLSRWKAAILGRGYAWVVHGLRAETTSAASYRCTCTVALAHAHPHPM